MFFDFESLAGRFEHHRDVDVERRIGIRQFFVIGILDVAARIFAVFFRIDMFRHECGVEVFQ